jgi:hypothetical protein
MRWTPSKHRRPLGGLTAPARRRRAFRPLVEALETRLAPANVDVLTFHNDNLRSAANTQEDILTPENVNSTHFGKLFSYRLDGYVYAQPLYKADLAINGSKHNVVFVANEHDSVYALDANQPDAKKGGGLLWQRSLIDQASGISTVPFQDISSSDIVPEVGITGTPVIDAASGTLYVVAKTKEIRKAVAHYVHKLYALDITTGRDRINPVTIGDTMFVGGNYINDTKIVVPGEGQGQGTEPGTVPFNSLRALQRASLVLSNGMLYVPIASHGDTQPYHGWVIGYSAQDLSLQTWFNTSPDNGLSGIWQSGGGPAVDQEGNLFFSTGNGGFTAFTRGPQALGQPGGSLGYGGLDYYAGVPPIRQSVAVKFDSFKLTPSGGRSSTGLYVNGHEPLNENLQPGDVFEDLGKSGIDFTAAGLDKNGPHTFEVTLTYDGKTLSETLTDRNVPTHTFTTSYPVNIPAQVGGTTGYVGFTGGTGGTWGTQDILTWTYGTAINHSVGFTDHSDLTANTAVGRNLTPRPVFVGKVARLTDAPNQSGSVFSNEKVDITNFTTTFTFQLHPPSSDNQISDGITFTIQAGAAGRDFGESVIRLSTGKGLQLADFFTPREQQQLNIDDTDLGSGATILLPDVGRGQFRHLAVETGKSGHIYLIDRDNMGGYHGPPILPAPGEDHVVNVFRTGVQGVWGSPAFWENRANLSEPEQLVRIGFLYYHGSGDLLKAFDVVAPADGSGTPRLRLAGQSGPQRCIDPPAHFTCFPFPGGQPVVSANGAKNGIVWDADVHLRGERSNLGPAELFAYNAEDVSQVLYHSNETSRRDLAGNAVKFVSPTVTNGHVYLGTQGQLDVYGLFADDGKPPNGIPSKLTVMPEPDHADTQLILSWTNNATNATGVRIERATQEGGPFAFVATVPRQATTFTDTGLTPSTRYFYQLVALNQNGESGPSNIASDTTLIPRSVLSVTDVGATAISLSWTRVQEADGRYDIYRSTDGSPFELAGTVLPDQTSFRDNNGGAGLPRGRYSYRVDAFNQQGISRSSNVVSATIGPIRIDHSGGFKDLSGLQENGNAKFAEAVARLADGTNQAGSVFNLDRVGIRTFTTTFTVRIHEGSDPRGEGFTFVIQADPREARVVGPGGGGLGYGPETPRPSRGIVRSVAIKFDLFDNAGEGSNSTGIFSGGRSPTIRDPALPPDPTSDIPDQSVNLDGTGIELNNQRTKRVTLTYDGTTLEETITDTEMPETYTVSYEVNIPGIVGSDTAFVGFTGATSSQRWTLFDIRTWTYDEGDESGLVSRRPLGLRGSAQGLDVNLNWRTANAYTAEGYIIERSTAIRGPFEEVARVVDPNVNSLTNTVAQAGVYYYRARAFNSAGPSEPSNVIRVTVSSGASSPSGSGSAGTGLVPELNDAASLLGTPSVSAPSAMPGASLPDKSATEGTQSIDAGGNSTGSAKPISDVTSGQLSGAHANAHRQAVDQLFGADDLELL